ncbi:hypothetical protein DW958_07385 [Ruminococcus sp. AM46-18]|nr:hypothetical protein DW958_07385 [Ruminococcus sp. AM46-18]
MIRIDIDRSSFRKEHFILQLKEEQESCLAEHGSCFIYWNTFCNKTEKLIHILCIIKKCKKDYTYAKYADVGLIIKHIGRI